MKILFVCGGLEPGRDGVGDYSRRVAAAGRARGWQPALLAIHDGRVREPEETGADGIPLLRLPRGEAWPERAQRAAAFIAAHAPQWVSVQFVGYALEPNGVVSGWGPRLAALLAGRRVHMMFHEIWIGDATEYGLRARLLGAMQRRGIRGLVRGLRPAAVHTSNHTYQRLLAGIGVRAGRLPLPGNIPVASGTAAVAGWPAIERGRCWVGGVFGTIHPRWQVEPWLAEMERLAGEAGRHLVLVQMGEAGEAGGERWARLAAAERGRVTWATLGPREPEEISRCLAQVDFGVATSPWALIEKSGATAAFLDHGVPVLVPRDDWRLRAGFTPAPAGDPLLFRSAAALMRALPMRAVPRDRTTEVARAMERDLGGVRRPGAQ